MGRGKEDIAGLVSIKEEKMKAYKGFDENLKCRGFQFEAGKITKRTMPNSAKVAFTLARTRLMYLDIIHRQAADFVKSKSKICRMKNQTTARCAGKAYASVARLELKAWLMLL